MSEILKKHPYAGIIRPDSFYEEHKTNELTRIFLALFGLDKQSWGIPREGEELPDLILKTAPYFANAEGRKKPANFRLHEAIIAFFGEYTEFFPKIVGEGLKIEYIERERKYRKEDIIWFWDYFRAHYADFGKINPYLKDLNQFIKTHHHDELRKRSPVKARGYTIPGYNFCGPKNSLDFVPTTMVDAICMYHDLVYANRPHSFEKDDDKEFNLYLKLWSQANLGDGWTGPTAYEKITVIPFIQAMFKMKNAVGSESPWTKALIPTILRDYVTNFKNYIKDPNFQDTKQLALVKHSPLIALEKMLDNSFASARKDRLLDKQFQALNEATEQLEEVKQFWNAQAAKHPDARHIAFKEFSKYEHDTPLERWLPGMIIPQYIQSSDTFILNYHGHDGMIWPIYFVRDGRVPDIQWSWSENPSKLMFSPLAGKEVPYAVHKSYESRGNKIPGIDWEPIHAVWSTLEDPSRQIVESPGHREIYKRYKSEEEANAAAQLLIEQEERAKQTITEQPEIGPRRQGQIRNREDDIEDDGGENKQPRLDLDTEDKKDVIIRPASPNTARRVGQEALAGARDKPRSGEIKEEITEEIKTEVITEVQPDGTEEEIEVETEMPNKDTTEAGQLVGGVSIGLGPPRSLIKLKRQTFTCDVILRDFHLLDYSFGSSIFESSWLPRTLTKAPATGEGAKPGYASYDILDRFTHGKRVAAQCIPLDIASMCLDSKARFDLNNLPWAKLKFLGGNIAIHGPRHKENQTINQSRMAYSDGGPGLNNLDRKIMWKMYDRERDYNWIYDITNTTDKIEAAVSRDTITITKVDSLTEHTEDRKKIRLGQTITAWSKAGDKKFFPQLCKLSTDPNGLTSVNTNGDRLYESMNDHALAEGPLTFPMMGWPYYVRNPQQDLGFNDLLTKKVSGYPLQNIADISFVGLNYPTMSEYWGKNRETRAAKIAGESTHAATTKFNLAGTANYKSNLQIHSKADTNSSSHCAMIHVPPLPLYDGKTNYSAVACDVVIQGTFEMDFTCPKDVQDYKAIGALGEIWDDTIDPTFCPYGGYGMKNFAESRVQWVTGAGAYMRADILAKLQEDTIPAIEVVYGPKDVGNVKISGTSAV